jgi:hypothetical protein
MLDVIVLLEKEVEGSFDSG